MLVTGGSYSTWRRLPGADLAPASGFKKRQVGCNFVNLEHDRQSLGVQESQSGLVDISRA
jgi:hypothetical protein